MCLKLLENSAGEASRCKYIEECPFYAEMAKGYMEMSVLNLALASECATLEYEADEIVERAVSGG